MVLKMEHNVKTIKLTNDLFSFFKSELGFGDWELVLKMPKEIPEDHEGIAGMIDNISYKYFHATVTIFIENNGDFEELALTIVHEMMHIISINGLKLIMEGGDYEKKFVYHIGQCIMDAFISQASLLNEQCTELISRVFYNILKKHKEYIRIKKEYKKT